MSFAYSGSGHSVDLERGEGGEGGDPLVAGQARVAMKDLAGLWYRRFQPFHISPDVGDAQVRGFAANESRDAFFAMLEMAPNTINNPARESVANRKPYQLARAQAAGFDTPDTLITNDPEEVARFWKRLDGEVVFKILTNTRTQFTETRVLTERELAQLPAARYAPTIFQRKLEAAHHLRVTVVDDEIFAARVTPAKPEARYDWRLDYNIKIDAVELAPDLCARAIGFMRDLGLRYGAIDFLVTEDGKSWFLEVNPSGQFLFVELDTGLPISRAIALALLKPRPIGLPLR